MNLTLIKWLPGLAAIVVIVAIAVLAWPPGAPKNEAPVPTRVASASAGLPPAVEPDRREDGPLSPAELRWCITEQLRLDAIRPRLATRPAADRYNQLAEGFNGRCGGRSASNEARDAMTSAVDASRESIVAAAIEDAERLNNAVPLPTDEAQDLLSMLGYDPGVVNGVYGAQTKAAIMAFQRQQGRPVDGLQSRELLDQLARALARDLARSERCRVRSLSDTGERTRAGFRC